MSGLRRPRTAHRLCGERIELLRALPDRRTAAQGPLALQDPPRRLASDARRTRGAPPGELGHPMVSRRTRALAGGAEFRILSDPRFLKRIQRTRESLKKNRGRRLEDVRRK